MKFSDSLRAEYAARPRRKKRPAPPVVVEKPSLPLWVTPAEDEPAHGVLFRLAERNNIQKPHFLVTHTGLKLAELRFGRKIDKLAGIIRCSPSDLLQSTFVIVGGGWCSVRGQRLLWRRDIEASRRRVCPQCVSESSHHRFWFDVSFISTCPKHEIELIRDCSCGHALSWDDFRITKCRHCDDGNVTNMPTAEADENALEMDKWILGRLGVADPVCVPILDELSLTRAFEIIMAVGMLLHRGRQGNRQMKTSRLTTDITIYRARAAGFQILRDGAVDQVLDRVYADYTPFCGVASFGGAYGWFGPWFIRWQKRTASEISHSRFADLVISNALKKSLAYRRKEMVNDSKLHSVVGNPGTR